MTTENFLIYRRYENIEYYYYTIDDSKESIIKDNLKVTIVFKNGVFDYVNFPFTGHYDRNQWKVLALIEKEIQEIEENNNKNLIYGTESKSKYQKYGKINDC